MSIQCGQLCSVIIKQYFGENAQKVADVLVSSGSRSLSSLVRTTRLRKSQVSMVLAVLIKFQLVTFESSFSNECIAEYSLNIEAVLQMLRYPRYVHLMHTKYETVGSTLTEELLRSGSQTATQVILKCFSSAENKDKMASYRDTFVQMVNDNYLIRCATPKISDTPIIIPTLEIEAHLLFRPPELDLHNLQKMHSEGTTDQKTQNDDACWRVNFVRLHQDFRDTVMTTAVERKMGSSAAECFRYILQQMYEKTDAWRKDYSNPISYIEVKQAIEKMSNNLELMKNLDQYMTLIYEDRIGFIRKIGDTGGGQYVVELKKVFDELLQVCTENIITEKFGSKASRIFRVIRSKRFIEQEEIQKEAMMPSKEAKLLTYKLFEEQFVQIKTIRKAGGGGTGPAKSFFLFTINEKQIAKMVLDMCYKALYNAISRSTYEKMDNKRLIDKSQKLDSIVEAMKERGESDEYIAEILETLTPPEREVLEKVKARIKTLSSAELAIDDTLFLFQMHQFYNSP